MSGFTQHIDSPFPDENILFNSASGLTGQQLQKNQLAIQGQQMDLTAADHEQVGRLAAGLLNEPDLAKRADLYARGVGMLQAQNLAKYAPPTLPDESTLRSLVSQTIPAQTQAEWLQNLTANKAYTNAGSTASTAAPGGASVAPPAAGGPAPFVGSNLPQGVTPDEDQLVRTVYGEARGEPVAGQQAVASVIKTRMGLGKQGVQDVVFAPNQFEAWSDPKNRPGMEALDPNSPQYQSILNTVVRPVMSGQAQDPTGGATNFYNPALQAQLGRSTPGFAQGNQTTIGNHTFFYAGYAPRAATTAAATPATTPVGGGATTAPYTVASTAPVPPPGSTAAPVATTLPPAQTDTTQPPAPTAAAPAPATAQPPQPGVRQPPQPPRPPPAAPLPPPPQMPVLNANGLTDIQQRQVNALAANSQNKQPAVAAAQQAFVNQNIQLRQQAFSDYMQQQQLAVQQGTLSNAQAELNLKTWQAAHPVPTTPRFTGNSEAVWNPGTKAYEPVTPDNTNLGPHVAGSWGVNNTGQMQFLAGATRPAQGDFTEQAAAYHFDQPIVQTATTAGQASQNSLIQLNELADLVNKGQASGPEGPFRKRVAEFMEQHGFTPDAIKSWTGMSSGSDADLLQKLAVATVGASAKADLGSNVGIQSLHLYENANPGMTMLGGANQKVTNMIRVTRAMQDDYTQGLQEHFNTNQASFLHGGGYNEPVSVYNAQWQQRNNPQIGAAAMGILNGDEYGSWASRLGGSVQDATNAMKLAVRINPNATMNTGHGQELVKDVLARAGTK
jgi:spore germination cell wall hydrolase CwlJ-like protein